MKFRTDYVTNSSSSSFLVAFSNENFENALYGMMKQYDNNYYQRLVSDIKRHQISRQEVFEMFPIEAKLLIRYDMKRKYEDEMRYRAFRDFLKNPQNEELFNQAVEEELAKQMRELEEDCSKYHYFAKVTYCDHTDGEMEHQIMPSLPCTLRWFDHH